MRARVIGIDCAVDPRNVGLARGAFDANALRVLEAKTAGRERSIAALLIDWMKGSDPVLLALDAPLGWPAALGSLLVHHRAGGALGMPPGELFQRLTDRIVRQQVGRQPLEVGADRIARTAHAALALLGELRELTQQAIPLAWDPALTRPLSAIEVYPAATLRVHRLPASGYKRREQREIRREILAGLARKLALPPKPLLLENANALDAVVCLLAAKDFLTNQAMAPSDRSRARKEGWIWLRRPEAESSRAELGL